MQHRRRESVEGNSNKRCPESLLVRRTDDASPADCIESLQHRSPETWHLMCYIWLRLAARSLPRSPTGGESPTPDWKRRRHPLHSTPLSFPSIVLLDITFKECWKNHTKHRGVPRNGLRVSNFLNYWERWKYINWLKIRNKPKQSQAWVFEYPWQDLDKSLI